jgi:DNA repair exonuclease SbcCD ATPase subunit
MPDDQNPENESREENQPPTSSDSAIRTLQSEIEQTRTAVANLEQERDTALAAAQQAAAAMTASEAQMAELQKTALDAHRRAVLAENSGHVVPELVQGGTAEEIDASVETAKAAYARIAESVRTATEINPLPPVPAGASPRSEPPADELSPLQKITTALSRNGR